MLLDVRCQARTMLYLLFLLSKGLTNIVKLYWEALSLYPKTCGKARKSAEGCRKECRQNHPSSLLVQHASAGSSGKHLPIFQQIQKKDGYGGKAQHINHIKIADGTHTHECTC